jgi:hypothetical protein
MSVYAMSLIDLDNMTREARREAIRRIRENVAAIEDVYEATRELQAMDTVTAIINRLGIREAAATIATLVNAYSYDMRISRHAVRWASFIAGAFDPTAADRIRVRTTIHPSHISTIADALITNVTR